MLTMLLNGLFSKIADIFGIEKWWKTPIFFEISLLFEKLKISNFEVCDSFPPSRFYIQSKFWDIVFVCIYLVFI